MSDQDQSDPSLLSLAQASKLTGVRRDALERRIRQGEIAVRLIGKGKAAKLRLTAAELREAGLLRPPEPAQADEAAVPLDLSSLLAMIREQGARIAALEDQRFQLAGELGAAIERARLVEDRLRAVSASAMPAPPATAIVLPADGGDARSGGRATVRQGAVPRVGDPAVVDPSDGREPAARMTESRTRIEGLPIAHAPPPGRAPIQALGVRQLGRRPAARAIRLLGRAWRARRRSALGGSHAGGRDG